VAHHLAELLLINRHRGLGRYRPGPQRRKEERRECRNPFAAARRRRTTVALVTTPRPL